MWITRGARIRAVAWMALLSLTVPLRGEGGASLAQPVAGWIFDEAAGAIRTIAGIPGSCVLDAAVPAGERLRRAQLAPGKAFALVETQGAEGVALLRWDGLSPDFNALEDAPAAPELMTFSPTGRSAALAWGARVRTWTGLPGEPQLVSEFELPEAPAALAVSDDAQVAIAATGGSLYRVWHGSPQEISTGGRYLGLAFRPEAHDAAAAEASESLVLAVSATGAVREMIGPEQGVDRPVAVSFTLDGRRLAVANSGSVAIYHSGSAEAVILPCECRPDGLFRIAGEAVFLLKSSTKALIPVLDASGAEPKLFVVPVGGEQQ